MIRYLVELQLSYERNYILIFIIQSISNFKIPHNGEIKVYGREPCHFQFDCSYNISINTINTPSHMGSVIYHVEGISKKIFIH